MYWKLAGISAAKPAAMEPVFFHAHHVQPMRFDSNSRAMS